MCEGSEGYDEDAQLTPYVIRAGRAYRHGPGALCWRLLLRHGRVALANRRKRRRSCAPGGCRHACVQPGRPSYETAATARADAAARAATDRVERNTAADRCADSQLYRPAACTAGHD